MKKDKASYKRDKNLQERHNARALCVEALYQYGFNNVPANDLLNLTWFGSRNMPNEKTTLYYKILLEGVFQNFDRINQIIKEFAQKDESKMMPIDKAILRFAIYSLLYEKDTPHIVLINEGIELAKQYSGVDAHKFINGVLDSVYKKYVKNDETAPKE